MSHGDFPGNWLILREAADTAARNDRLTDRLARYLDQRQGWEARALTLADLGGGNGNNIRYLAPRLPGPQRWRLLDRDETLLDQAISRCRGLHAGDGSPVRLDTHACDLAALDPEILTDCELVTASALFDLVSADWCESLVAGARSVGAAVLFTLTFNGSWRFIAGDDSEKETAADREVRLLFNDHQQQDKGLGDALGGRAAEVLPGLLEKHGYVIETAPSPWQLQAGRPETLELGSSLVDGWARAAMEQAPQKTRQVQQWLDRRIADLESGSTGIRVDHLDVLGLPAENHRSRVS